MYFLKTPILVRFRPLINKDFNVIIHNSAIIIHPTGRVDKYNKWFFPNFGPFEEKLFFDGGESVKIINTKIGKFKK